MNYPDLPDIDSLSTEQKATAQNFKVTNLLLAFLDFFISEENFQNLNPATSNLVETVSDLNAYGYDVQMPQSANEYRSKVFPKIMEAHKRAGYFGVQVPVGGVPFDDNGMLTPEGIALGKELKELLSGIGLHISAVGGRFEDDWTKNIKPQIQAANLLGSKFLYGPFSTPFMYFPEVNSGEETVDWVENHLEVFSQTLRNEIGPFAAKYDVTVCEEPLQRFERALVTLKEATDLAIKTDIPQFKIMIDMCHECTDGEGPESYKGYVERLAAADKLQGLHISAVHRGKLYKSWFNQQYFNEFFGPVLKAGYAGEISIEVFDATEPVVNAVKVNRRKFKNPLGVMINNLAYSTDKLSKLS
ncbi:MAG: sugar phosphate isomerase/epimerase [Lentisphaeraceae bacterium]|nr:sugar phosphate isomerase/epimerase [Lentisphaeraceae bacterium]